MSKQPHHLASLALAEPRLDTTAVVAPLRITASRLPAVSDDERYPGSFFRVPGVPTPGKTTWSLSK